MELWSVLALIAVILLALAAIGVGHPRVALGWAGLTSLALGILLNWENVNW